jgi:hypothetical protein
MECSPLALQHKTEKKKTKKKKKKPKGTQGESIKHKLNFGYAHGL